MQQSKNNQSNQETMYNTIFSGVKSIVSRRTSPWVGTISDLTEALETRINVPSQWPGSPSAFRVALNKVVNRLRNAGISVKFTRATDRMRTRLVRFVAR